ncbi:hypothetical protein ACHAO9_001042 [Fusarium lateritium]
MPNLEQALRRLRSTGTVLRIWADFVCIDQDNHLERSTQVSLMARIYSWASLVPCWLGDNTPATAIGMEIISYLASDLPSWRVSGGSNIDMRPIRELLEQSVLQMNRQVGRAQNVTLLDVVHTMRSRKFTHACDSIYAVMGLVSPAEVAGFVPDYGQSWEETYNRFYDCALRNVLKNPEEEWEDTKGNSLDEQAAIRAI